MVRHLCLVCPGRILQSVRDNCSSYRCEEKADHEHRYIVEATEELLVSRTSAIPWVAPARRSGARSIVVLGFRSPIRGFVHARLLLHVAAQRPGVERPAKPARSNAELARNSQLGCRKELKVNQFRKLGRDTCHRPFCSAQATSGGQEGADFSESFIRRPVHDWD